MCQILGSSGGGREAMAAVSGLMRGLGRLLISRQTPVTPCQVGPKFSTCILRRSDEVNTADSGTQQTTDSSADTDPNWGVTKLSKREALMHIRKSNESRKKEMTRSIGVTLDQEDKSLQALSTIALEQDFQVFPDGDTAEQLFNGIKYKDLPYVYIRCTPQNTRISAWTADHQELWYTTCVAQGFLHSKKKSTVAAQAIGLAMGQKLRTMNQRTVRVRVDGFNMGRIPAVQGLTQAGLSVASVTDCTKIDWFWSKRAKKRKRL